MGALFLDYSGVDEVDEKRFILAGGPTFYSPLRKMGARRKLIEGAYLESGA